MGFGIEEKDDSESSTEDLSKNFDTSLRLGATKFEYGHHKGATRFSPYRAQRTNQITPPVQATGKTRHSDEKVQNLSKLPRRRHRSEPTTTAVAVAEKQTRDDDSSTSEHDKKLSKVIPPKLGITSSNSDNSYDYTNATTCHEEVNVNELAAYLENSVLIPRKMSSMAETIYG